MLAEERWNAILSIVNQQKTVTVPELAQELGISESTVRRDLIHLDHRRQLTKVHGGATALEQRFVLSDQAISERMTIHSEEKKKIGKYAASLIEDTDFVYLDAGSSVEWLVDALETSDALFLTNSIMHARKLLSKGCRVILPGGELKPKTEALIGEETVNALRRYHFTIGFWGANGVTPEAGFTTPEISEAAVKRISMEQTGRRFVLCDSSKFSLVSPVTFAEFESAEIITDRLLNQSYKKYHHITEVADQ